MSRDEEFAPLVERPASGTNQGAESGMHREFDELDEEMKQALGNFRRSVEAWSEAAYNRPRQVVQVYRRSLWRLAAGWALGCVLVSGAVSGAVHVRHQRQEQARIAAAAQAERQRLAAEKQARDEEELLAKVDSDVSRAVPSAMEPLAQLMAVDETQ